MKIVHTKYANISQYVNLLNTVRHKEQISRRDRSQLGGPNWSENLFIKSECKIFFE